MRRQRCSTTSRVMVLRSSMIFCLVRQCSTCVPSVKQHAWRGECKSRSPHSATPQRARCGSSASTMFCRKMPTSVNPWPVDCHRATVTRAPAPLGRTALWDSRSSPRSVEYIAALTSVLPALINDALGHAALSNTLQTNKLAVCLGGGSKYDEHIDTHEDGGDPRRLACLLYLQDEWVEEHGGCLRFFREAGPLNDRPGIRTGRALTVDDASVPTDGTARSSRPTVDIAPLGGRLVCFWCESLTHGVTPSYAPTIAAHRWALTVWLLQP